MFLKCWKLKSSSERKYPTIIHELCHEFSLDHLKKSTNNLDESMLLERRGLGVRIYKGVLQHNDGSDYTVAVKRFNVESSEGSDLFNNEIELRCQLHHPNFVSLIGFCNHEKEKLLVYEYLSNGSLYQHLQGERRETLSWKKRLEICIGIARGLHYLHTGAKRSIFHLNVTTSSIFLDDYMNSKLAAFSISVQGPRFTSKPKPIRLDLIVGTYGYTAMEHLRDGTVSDKCDVYSFGVVLLEVLCGINYLSLPSVTGLLEKPVEENIDPKIRGSVAPDCWQVFIDITMRCLKYEPDERPAMGEVEVELERAFSLQQKEDIANTLAHYTLLSKTIINLGPESEFEHALSLLQDADVSSYQTLLSNSITNKKDK